MKKILLLVVVLCLVWLVLGVGAVLAGHYQPPVSPIVALEQCADGPCMWHVTLDRTAWSDAVDQFKDRDDVNVSDDSITIALDKFTRIRFEKSRANETIRMFDLDFFGEQRPTLGAVIERFGFPCRVSPGNAAITLYYPNSLVMLRGNDLGDSPAALRPDSPISGFNVETVGNMCDDDRTDMLWRGFASVQSYLNGR